MYILTDADGNVVYIGTIDTPGAVFYPGVIPDDFGNTFALGKYKFDGTNINEVAGWVAPPPPPLPPGMEPPPAP